MARKKSFFKKLRNLKTGSQLVVFNTVVSYAKMVINMAVLLYTTRIVLNALGASDLGVYNLTAGLIGMLSFLNASMTVSTQRYLSFYQGTGDFNMQRSVFSNSWIMHVVIGLVAVFILLSISPFLFNGFLNIDNDKISTARTVYYFMAASIFFTFISVPFNAAMNAHEDILYTSIIDVFGAFYKLVIAFSLHYFIQNKRLGIYGTLMASLSMFTFLLYASFSLRKYKECSVTIYHLDKGLIKELSVYTSWNLFANFSRLGRVQGVAVLLNIFFGTVVNAAYGIANQMAGQFSFFSATLLRALNPQIMKSEGMNNRERMLRLSMLASKSGFSLFAIFAIPCIYEMPQLLKLWLKTPPENTAYFCSLFLILLLVEQLTIGLLSAMQSVGRIKLYQLLVGVLWLSIIPLSYLLLKFGLAPSSVLICSIIIEIIATYARMFLAKKIIGLSIKVYIKTVLVKLIFAVVGSIFVCYLVTYYFSFGSRFILTIFASMISYALLLYFTGLENNEKLLVDSAIARVLRIFGKKSEPVTV